jgi:hypothetical protein
MVRHIRRGYDGTDENPLLMRWTIPAALMYCITIYTTIGNNNVNPFFSFYYMIPEHIFLSCRRLTFSAGQTNGASFIISAKTMSSSRK